MRAAVAAFPDRVAVRDADHAITYAELGEAVARSARKFADAGIGRADVIAICALNSAPYAIAYLAAVSMGAIVAPLPQSATAESLVRMIADCDARAILVDADTATMLRSGRVGVPMIDLVDLIACGPEQERISWPALAPTDPFNIIYSSGTTGTPKGIIQSHAMREAHVKLGESCRYRAGCVTLLSTPLYSNTTLISLLPTLALGGTAVLMRKFDVEGFLALCQEHRVTHAMLVPIQYQRLMASDRFASHDLSAFEEKFCTSAPFALELKRDILDRWPGGLTEYYGMTEGGGLCILSAHDHPDKLHTVGRPAPETDMRIIDEDGRELPPGEIGEIVGASRNIMSGYHNRPDATDEAMWTSPTGRRYMRTGDIGRFDEDGFLILMDRKKDVIISGGFNIYPSDLEDILHTHPHVEDAAVVGVASARWGETPVAFIVGAQASRDAVMEFVNQRVGKSQRLADLRIIESLPRSQIGKILKRELREAYGDDSRMNRASAGNPRA